MKQDNFFIESFEPLWLTIENIGPFRESPYEIDFTNTENQPCNIFLLMSQNGRGKTTILEIMYCLMSMLAKDKPTKFGHEDLDDGRGRVQWDLRLKLDWRGEKHCVVLSLLAGKDKPVMKNWFQTPIFALKYPHLQNKLNNFLYQHYSIFLLIEILNQYPLWNEL